jgi:hypothetical protein
MIEIEIENNGEIAPLFLKYRSQVNPQKAYIEIDPREIKVYAEINKNIGGGMSLDAWNGKVCQIPCPGDVWGPALEEYLKSSEFEKKVIELCENWGDKDIEESIEFDLMELEKVYFYDGEEWLEDAIEFYNEEGNQVWYPCDAVQAIYNTSLAEKMIVCRENIGKIKEDCLIFADNQTIVDDIEEYLERIIEEMEYNQ